MSTLTLRNVKGSPLTNTEVDENFTNLNTDKLEGSDLSVTVAAASGTGYLNYNSVTGEFTYTPPDLTGLGGGDPEPAFTILTTGIHAVSANQRYGIDASGGPVTVDLPESPAAGTAILFADATGTGIGWDTNLSIYASGSDTIQLFNDPPITLLVSTTGDGVIGLMWTGSVWVRYAYYTAL